MREVPELGRRGGGWVVLQFAVIGAAVVSGIVGPSWPAAVSDWLSTVGGALALAGVVLALLSARALGRSLTPFPRPSSPGRFVGRGPYRLVRHPIYLGGLLFVVGFSLFASPWALIASAALAVVWGLKVSLEERFLRLRYPEYDGYCRRTRFRLVPFVY